MPGSESIFDKDMRDILKWCVEDGLTRFLDIGAGTGKYGSMLRGLETEIGTALWIEAIEMDQEYARDIEIAGVYKLVHRLPVEEFLAHRIYHHYCTQVVIFGDVLEHIPKAIGLNLIHYFAFRCNYMLLVLPGKRIQYGTAYHPQETHLSLWQESDFLHFKRRVLVKGHKILITLVGLFSDPDALIDGYSYEIMRQKGCDVFKGKVIS